MCACCNGDASWVARLAAVEFESIYAVSHPGRARLHGFGIFGGSNGYWKTERGVGPAVATARQGLSLDEAARTLVNDALDRGSDDNTTVVMVRAD